MRWCPESANPPPSIHTPSLRHSDAGAVIVSGGPQSVYDPESLTVDTAVWDMPCPVLGICYGMQLMCQNLGGKVEEATAGEYGRASLNVIKPDSRLFAGVDAVSDAWMSHRDRVVAVPDGYVLSHTPAATVLLVVAYLFHARLITTRWRVPTSSLLRTDSKRLAPQTTVHLPRAKTWNARCTGCSFTRK